MGIFEREFWPMSPGEFDERWDMFRRREERELERLAWLASRLLAAWCKNPPSPDELLGRMKSV